MQYTEETQADTEATSSDLVDAGLGSGHGVSSGRSVRGYGAKEGELAFRHFSTSPPSHWLTEANGPITRAASSKEKRNPVQQISKLQM